MIRLIIVPLFLLAMIVGCIAGMQYMSGDRAEAIKTAQGGLAVVAETVKYIFIGIVATEILFAVLLIAFFTWRT